MSDSNNATARVFPLDSKPFGVLYETWVIKFWQWLISIPADRSPVTDQTGERCGEGQVGTLVFNLAFSDIGGAERRCTIQAGKSILVPINVVLCTDAEFPGASEADLDTLAERDESSDPFVFLSVDGAPFEQLQSTRHKEKLKDIREFRVRTRAFDVIYPANSPFGPPGTARAVADGYYAIIEALEPGEEHEIIFKARLTNPDTKRLFYSDRLRYTINVLADQVTQDP
jgi:hypothetical protein